MFKFTTIMILLHYSSYLIGNAAIAKPKEYLTEDYYDYSTPTISIVTVNPSEPDHTDHPTEPLTWVPTTREIALESTESTESRTQETSVIE